MNHWYFIAPIAAVSGVAILALGVLLGYKLRDIVERINELLGRVEDIENQLEEEDDTGIIETTPQLIEKKRRAGKLPAADDEESAIVTVKSPRQLAEEKAAREKAELDEIQGHSSRIGP